MIEAWKAIEQWREELASGERAEKMRNRFSD